jgi:endonuclease/exonuclease/phosphatase family metal-dependent hydrolase
MRVVAYNVSGGLDPVAAGGVLAALEPQVACLVEVPGKGRLRRLARAADLVVAARAGRRGTGTAILIHPDVRTLSTGHVPLSTPPDVPRREAVHAILGVGGQRLSVTSVQLGLRPEVRQANLAELTAFLETIDVPSVVGCDLNESVRGPVASSLAADYQDAFAAAGRGRGETYPTPDPATRQDFVFVDRRLPVDACFVPSDDTTDVASHHRPVVVDLAVS